MQKIKIFLLITLSFLLVGCSQNAKEAETTTSTPVYEISIYYPTKEYIETGNDQSKMEIDNKYNITSNENSEIYKSDDLIKVLRENPKNENLIQGIPEKITINSINIEENIATVDLSSKDLNGSSLEEENLINQIVLSLMSITKDNKEIIKGVNITVDNKKQESLMGHYDTSKTLDKEI